MIPLRRTKHSCVPQTDTWERVHGQERTGATCHVSPGQRGGEGESAFVLGRAFVGACALERAFGPSCAFMSPCLCVRLDGLCACELVCVCVWGHGYLVQGESADTECGQLDGIQQGDLGHAIGFCSSTGPILVTFNLRGEGYDRSTIHTHTHIYIYTHYTGRE